MLNALLPWKAHCARRSATSRYTFDVPSRRVASCCRVGSGRVASRRVVAIYQYSKLEQVTVTRSQVRERSPQRRTIIDFVAPTSSRSHHQSKHVDNSIMDASLLGFQKLGVTMTAFTVNSSNRVAAIMFCNISNLNQQRKIQHQARM